MNKNILNNLSDTEISDVLSSIIIPRIEYQTGVIIEQLTIIEWCIYFRNVKVIYNSRYTDHRSVFYIEFIDFIEAKREYLLNVLIKD